VFSCRPFDKHVVAGLLTKLPLAKKGMALVVE
jgi:hypothetical protein